MHDAYGVTRRRRGVLKMMSPEQTRWQYKKIVPSFLTNDTFYEMQTDAKKTNEKTRTRTNV